MIYIPADVQQWSLEYDPSDDDTSEQVEVLTALSRNKGLLAIDFERSDSSGASRLAFSVIGTEGLSQLNAVHTQLMQLVQAHPGLDPTEVTLLVWQVPNDGMFDEVGENDFIPEYHLSYECNNTPPQQWAHVQNEFAKVLLTALQYFATIKEIE